jgi:hypothetical protein
VANADRRIYLGAVAPGADIAAGETFQFAGTYPLGNPAVQ